MRLHFTTCLFSVQINVIGIISHIFFPTEKYKIEEGQGSQVFSATFIFGTEKNEKVRKTEYLMGFKLSDVKKFPIENLLSRGQG